MYHNPESRVLVTPKFLDKKLWNPLLLLNLDGPATVDLYNQDGDLTFSADVDKSLQLEARHCSYPRRFLYSKRKLPRCCFIVRDAC